MLSRPKKSSFQNIMTLPKYYDAIYGILLYWKDNCFSFSLKSILAQFKFIPNEFKYRRDSNGLILHFRTLTKTDARIHAKSMFSIVKSPTGPQLLLNSTALHCSAGCQPPPTTTKTVLGVGEVSVWCQKLVPRDPGSPLTQKVVHWLKGGEWALLYTMLTPQSAEHGAVKPQNGMSFPHSVCPLPSVHCPNQVSDWTSTLAWLDCTTLLCWMPAPTYYYKNSTRCGRGVSVVPKTCLG